MRTALLTCLLLSTTASASSIDRELVRRIISTKSSDFRRCYDQAMKAEASGFGGKAVLTLTVNADGTVTKVDVDFPHEAESFTSCLRTAALELRFPKFSGGDITLKWPITFVPSP